MRWRTIAILSLACLGCHTAIRPAPAPRESEKGAAARTAPATPTSPSSSHTPASHERAAGGTRLTPASPGRADPDRDPIDENRHLTLAAAYLEQGNDETACQHLGLFLERHPHHGNVRFYYAELLMRLGRLPEARLHYEEVIADLQEEQSLDFKHLTHCHTRLAELSER